MRGLEPAKILADPLAVLGGALMPHAYETDGAAIYRQSFATIRAEADLARFSPDEEPVVVRMIHAAGMVGLEAHVRFTPRHGDRRRARPCRAARRSCATRAWSPKASRARGCRRAIA